MEKDSGNSHSTVDVEKIHKGTVAIVSACRIRVQLVSGAYFRFASAHQSPNYFSFLSFRCAGLLIPHVILFLSHMRHSDGPKNSISKCQSFAVGASARRHTFVGRGQYGGHWRCAIGPSTVTLAGLNQRTNGQSIRRREILSLHSYTITVSRKWKRGGRINSFDFKKFFPTCRYPMLPPTVRFLTKIFHPNVSRHGDVGIDIIQHNWLLSLTISKILLSVQSLLTDPFTEVRRAIFCRSTPTLQNAFCFFVFHFADLYGTRTGKNVW